MKSKDNAYQILLNESKNGEKIVQLYPPFMSLDFRHFSLSVLLTSHHDYCSLFITWDMH